HYPNHKQNTCHEKPSEQPKSGYPIHVNRTSNHPPGYGSVYRWALALLVSISRSFQVRRPLERASGRELVYFLSTLLFVSCLAKNSYTISLASGALNPWPAPSTTCSFASTPAFLSAASSSSLWLSGTSLSLSPCMMRNGGASLVMWVMGLAWIANSFLSA